MSAEAIASSGVGVALLAVLVPLLLTLHGRVVAEIGELRRDLHALAERVTCIKSTADRIRLAETIVRAAVRRRWAALELLELTPMALRLLS